MKLNEALVEALIDLDVRYVFGVSGANIEHLHDAIHRLGKDRLQSVMSKSEYGAAFMADCRARVHRTLGVCCSTSGGGMMNLIAGIAESYAESVPVLALIGQPPSEHEGRGAFQESSGIGRTVNSKILWSAVAKYVAKICDPGDFWQFLAEAVKAALSGRPGPAVLLFPREIFETEVAPRPEKWAENLRNQVRLGPVDMETVRSLFDAIRRAGNPVIIIGQGVRRSSAPNAVSDFARAAGLPIAATLSGRGEFFNGDPLYLGMLGVAGHPSVHTYLKEEADLLIVAGAGLNLMTRHPISSVLPNKKIAVVNIDASEISRSFSPDLIIEADAGQVFQALLELLKLRPFRKRPLEGYIPQIYEPILAEPLPSFESAPQNGDRPLLQSEAVALLQDILPEKGHLLYDAGNCAVAALHMTRVPFGSSSTIALGMGGMGYAIAAAIGAQLGSPSGARTVVFAGDGAFLITGFEIHTAVDLQLPILFIVFNNNMHGMCAMRQQLYFESRLECVRYAPVDVALAVRGFGSSDRLWAGSAETLEELREQIEDYRKHMNLPGVLELRLRCEEIPPFTPFLSDSAATVPFRAAYCAFTMGC